jgi:hypothetical protein
VKFERYIWRISEAGQNFCSERAYVLQGIYVGDGCSHDDLDVVGYECLEYDEKTEHASSDDKEGGHGGWVDPRERWALEICCEHFAVFVLLYVEVRGDGCSVVDRLGYWDHRCASRSQSVDYPGHGIADGGCIKRWGTVEEPLYQTKSYPRETASAYACRAVDAKGNGRASAIDNSDEAGKKE